MLVLVSEMTLPGFVSTVVDAELLCETELGSLLACAKQAGAVNDETRSVQQTAVSRLAFVTIFARIVQ